jgi:hypothetical protein
MHASSTILIPLLASITARNVQIGAFVPVLSRPSHATELHTRKTRSRISCRSAGRACRTLGLDRKEHMFLKQETSQKEKRHELSVHRFPSRRSVDFTQRSWLRIDATRAAAAHSRRKLSSCRVSINSNGMARICMLVHRV